VEERAGERRLLFRWAVHEERPPRAVHFSSVLTVRGEISPNKLAHSTHEPIVPFYLPLLHKLVEERVRGEEAPFSPRVHEKEAPFSSSVHGQGSPSS
jgi:hypothetical protein